VPCHPARTDPTRTLMRTTLLAATLSVVIAAAAGLGQPASARTPAGAAESPGVAATVPSHGVVGITDEAMLEPGYWTSSMAAPGKVLMSRSAISVQNRRLFELDPSMHDLGKIPATLSAAQIRGWIEGVSSRPT